MNCKTLEDLAEHFQSKVALVKNCLQLGGTSNDSTAASLLSSISSQLRQLDVLLLLMKAELEKRRQKLQEFEALKECVNEMNDRLSYAETHLPEKLPRKNVPSAHIPEQFSKEQTKQSQHEQKSACPPGEKKKSKHIPAVEYLTVQEFESVPKYMRGRISYQQMNSAIDAINQAIQVKYNIMYHPKSSQTEQIKKKIQLYRSQQTKETKNCHFFVEDDLRRNSTLKMDNVARNMLNMLRSCGRLKEVRGGNLTRYVLCEV